MRSQDTETRADTRADRRIERTRGALMQAFIGLLMVEGFEHITVAALVERANVGRSTFYTHFRGRHDILRVSLTTPSLPLARIVGHVVGPTTLSPLIHHFQQNRRLGRAFAEGSLRALWVRRLAELIEPDAAALARRLRARPLLPLPLVSLQLAEAQISLIVHALASRQPVATDTLATALIATTQALAAALLQCDAEAVLAALEPAAV